MAHRRSAAHRLFLAIVLLSACGKEEGTRSPAPSEPAGNEVLEGCSAFAERLCASAGPCCESSGAPFSAERCTESFVREACRPAADVVSAGLATYHPEAIEPCLEAYAAAHATCAADWQEILSVRRDVWTACKMIRGNVEAGRGCSTSSSCASPDGPATARCIQSSCRVLEILGEGASCQYPNGDVSVCDQGLYCTALERDATGVCAMATAEGADCDPLVPLNPECGLGSYCGSDDGRCRRATNFGGPSCTEGPECVSFTCDPVVGRCTDAPSLAADLCAGGAS